MKIVKKIQIKKMSFLQSEKSLFLICFPMDYRDFSVKSKVIISLFQTVKLSLSKFTVCKFVLSRIKYHRSLLIRSQLAKTNWCVCQKLRHAHLHVI